MYKRCSILKEVETWTSDRTSPVDSMVKPKRDIVEKLEFGCPFKPGTIGEKDATLAEVLMQEAAEEIKRLRDNLEWQIKQNVKMFTALEQIAKDTIGYGHMGYGQPTAVALLAKEAMVEAV